MGNWGDFTLFIGVITPFLSGRGPSCMDPTMIIRVSLLILPTTLPNKHGVKKS